MSFAEPQKLIRYQERHRWPFSLFADPERAAYRTFALERLSLLRVLSPATLRLYWRLWRQGMRLEGSAGDDVYQGGGDFLVDREGNILYAHRSQDPADRPSAAKLLEAIDRIATGS